MNRIQESSVQPKFAVGTSVRVKVGVMDPDFPSIPLGNWTGTVSDVEKESRITYLVQWSPHILESVHPTCQRFCEKWDVAFDKMWLLEEDLEPVDGASSVPKWRENVAAELLPC